MTPILQWTEEQKRAVAAVTATIPGYQPNTGTAFYVGGGYAVTALHVVADTRPRQPLFAETIDLSFPSLKYSTKATLVAGAWDQDADWVILKCTDPPQVNPLELGVLPQKDSAVEAFGYPVIQTAGFSLPALVQDPRFLKDDSPVIDLYSEKGKGVALYGLSGSPCFQRGKVVGILRSVLETEVLNGQLKPKLVTDAGTVYACPVASIIKWQEVHGRAILPATWAPDHITTSNFIVYLSTAESRTADDGKLQGVVKAAGKHFENLNLGAPHFEWAEDIISSDEKLLASAAALCRAKVVVFDATAFEPAIMLLVGIRSVVRRGVTILSVGGGYALGSHIEVPFNVADANVVAHSDAQDEQTPNSVDLLAERIKRGVSGTGSPYYLDVPVYDALRRIPADHRGVIPSEQGVLVLCSFEKTYSELNWRNLKRALKDQLKALRTKRLLDPEGGDLGVSRSFELQSPRLVSQAIYENIRRAKSCIVDLTGWSPNVLFELGVRLAASSNPTACLLEKEYQQWFLDEKHPERRLWEKQCDSLVDRFVQPTLRYDPKKNWVNEPAYSKAFGSDADLPSGLASGTIHATIENAIDVNSEPASRLVYRELMDSADLFAKDAGSSKPVGLYPGNVKLTECEEVAEFERLLAGWFYLFSRFSEEEILGDHDKSAAARELAVLLANRDARFKALPESIRDRVKKFRRLKA